MDSRRIPCSDLGMKKVSGNEFIKNIPLASPKMSERVTTGKVAL
jgi:hypothetical protein